ncbi:hypothetical protein LOK49_LG08G02198 [Camellia lanceoleosa]|uniref:Uncharacterized protein n=1 Tax=Camellia lanceoleosa TaxID=1840588 RepID=A0ACC0GUX9_9ERIC|nr:hypothetical protein LOK49_LG08G02198 [Camellia lanceoleosa]
MVHKHILLVTSPSQGAINPALQLANQLIRMGVKVTIVTCVSAHRCMAKTTMTPEGLTFVFFSDGYDDGFKFGHGDFEHFISELNDRGSKKLAQLITASAEEGNPVTGLVYTMLQTWVAKVAQSFHIPSTLLWTQPATLFHLYFYYFSGYGDIIRSITNDPSCLVELPVLPQLSSRDLPSFLVHSNPDSDSKPCKDLLLAIKEQLHTLNEEANPRILVNTFDALEPEVLRAIEKLNLIAIGPLVPYAFLDRKHPSNSSFGADLFQKSRDYLEWLDSKLESSVVYVSFGSMAILSKRQVEEIARGLLGSHRPFLWVIRATENGEKEEDELSCREELDQLGMIVPWCSQVEVLSHPSLGCFVSHCGWNSSLECLMFGVPMVCFPQLFDQPTNAKLIEDVFKTGVRVTMNEDGIVEGEEIQRCIEVVMGGGEKGKEMNKNAKKWRDLAKEAAKEGGSMDMNLRAFVDEVEKDFIG